MTHMTGTCFCLIWMLTISQTPQRLAACTAHSAVSSLVQTGRCIPDWAQAGKACPKWAPDTKASPKQPKIIEMSRISCQKEPLTPKSRPEPRKLAAALVSTWHLRAPQFRFHERYVPIWVLVHGSYEHFSLSDSLLTCAISIKHCGRTCGCCAPVPRSHACPALRPKLRPPPSTLPFFVSEHQV